VLELLDTGIDVYTSMNVQHVESLNDVIAKITGVVGPRDGARLPVLEQAARRRVIDLRRDL